MTAATDATRGGRFSPRVVLAMIVVGVVAFAGFLVLSAYAPDLRGGQDGGGHALSRSAVGYAALERLLRADGVPTVISRDAEPPAGGLWVLTPAPGAELDNLLEGEHGAVLVVLPKWDTAPNLQRRGWVRNGGPIAEPAILRLLERLASSNRTPEAIEAAGGKPTEGNFSVGRRPRPGAVELQGTGGLFEGSSRIGFSSVDRLQTLEGEAFIPVLVDETGRTVLAQLQAPRQSVYVLSDPDLLNTYGLRNARDATSAVLLMRSLSAGGAVTFDVTLHGFERGRGILRTAFEPPFLGATLCLVAAALLMGLHAAARFGPTARPGRVFALGKAALADNAAGLIALAGREARLLPAYAGDTRTAVAREIGAPRGLAGPELDAFLDRVGLTSGATEAWTALDAQARLAHGADGALDVARRLSRWRMEMTRGRR